VGGDGLVIWCALFGLDSNVRLPMVDKKSLTISIVQR
jgi:hypothetical protein